jgi:hypothetical protein
LTIKVSNKSGLSLDEIRVFLKASEAVHFEGEKKEEVYAWVSGFLGEQNWDELGRMARGLVRRYMEKMTGLSRAQITRLITRYGEDGEVRLKRSRRHRFAPLNNHGDEALLASVDTAHETLSGPATQKILQRQCHDFGDRHYDRLAQISVAQICRLRKSGELPARAKMESPKSGPPRFRATRTPNAPIARRAPARRVSR